MAELQQMQVNEINEEENISLEKQAAMQEEAAQQRNQTLEADPKAGKETIEEQLKEEEPERPEWLDEKFESPEEMAEQVRSFMEAGLINIIGGCCGTSPDHIQALAELAQQYQPRKIAAIHD